MMETNEFIFFRNNAHRSKFKEDKKSVTVLKNKLFKEKNGICYMCENVFLYNKLELENKIPIIIGGHFYDVKNIDLICKKCHINKTGIDRRVFNIMKKLNMIRINGNETLSIYNFQDIEYYYVLFSKILNEGIPKFEEYDSWDSHNYTFLDNEDY